MGFLEERDTTNVPTIPEYYKGKCIFITGGSGFMGKILIEKLLYSCSDLERIYLLLRSKKGVKPEERLKDIYSIQCFDRLRKEKPDIFMSKITVISGDVMELGLGLSEEDRALLVEKIDVIFHVAASVRFDDPLKYATMLNLRGTRELVALAKEMKGLSALIHVSTSYSNTNRDLVEEIMYPPHADWRDTINICETLDEQTLKVLTPKYLGELPNTYTFTKQLAEHVVYEERGRLPIVIIRPSIVISSLKEPMPGWVDNYNGPVGLLAACGKGIMRSLYTDPHMIADYIPVDVCMSSIIVAAWARGTTTLQTTDDIPIYNCASSNLYKVSYKEVTDMGRELARKVPLDGILWHVGGSITKSRTIHYIKVLLLHLLPALIIDSILWTLGRKPMLIKLQRRIYIVNLALEYFIIKQWTFDNKNLMQLRETIKEEDEEQFKHQIEGMEIYEFFYRSYIGAKKYLLKEKEEDLPKAKAHTWRMMILDYIVKILFYAAIIWWILTSSYTKSFLENLNVYVY